MHWPWAFIHRKIMTLSTWFTCRYCQFQEDCCPNRVLASRRSLILSLLLLFNYGLFVVDRILLWSPHPVFNQLNPIQPNMSCALSCSIVIMNCRSWISSAVRTGNHLWSSQCSVQFSSFWFDNPGNTVSTIHRRFSCRSWAPLVGDGDDIITELAWVTANGIAQACFSGRAKGKFLYFLRPTILQQKNQRL